MFAASKFAPKGPGSGQRHGAINLFWPQYADGRGRWPRAARKALLAALGVAALALTGCGDLSRFRTENHPPAKLAIQASPQSPATEREHERILAAYGGAYDNPKLQTLTSRIVARLVAASERPDLHYKVTILNSAAVNAFALPSGQLYVTRGLIALANDSSELSSVLAHEMAHVIARHAAIRENQARQTAIVARVVNNVLSDPEAGALALAKSKLTMASFSRSQEFEADGIGVGIAARAGYDAYGAVRFLTAMERNVELARGRARNSSRALDFLSSHPATPERAQNALANARQFSSPGAGERDRAEYLNALDGMVFGEDPNEGFVRGRRFLHPALGFTFTAPDGMTLDNTAQAVVGVKDGGAMAMRFDVVRVPAEQPLVEYLVSGWMENVDNASAHAITINGFPGATATARGDKWRFRIFVLRFGSDVYRFVWADKAITPASDRIFREAVNSFRRLTLAEIQAAQPAHLRLVKVEQGDTIATMGQRMALAVPDHPAERFAVLNGLDKHAHLTPGQRVKLVVD